MQLEVISTHEEALFLKIVFVVTAGVVIVPVIVAVYIVPVIVTIVVLSVANVTLCRSSK